jgi:L-iditol 2-dehydrogenase
MKALLVKKLYDYELMEMGIPECGPHDVLVQVKACGLCGTDLRTASMAEDFQPIGHEIAGIVHCVGSAVQNVRPGQDVCLESGTFDRFSSLSRNGQVDKDMTGRSMFNTGITTMGFAEYILVPCESCVPFSGMSYAEASLTEPLGVAYDLLKVTGHELGEDVLVYGIGPIGLFALRLARLMGARRIYAVNTSGRNARDRLAKAWGADEVIHSDRVDLLRYPFPKGGVDRILMTAPPSVMPDALKLLNIGGIMGFIGIGVDDTRYASFDMRLFHDRKLQIRASNAVPALYFPACLELCASGMVDMKAMISHTLSLDSFAGDVSKYMKDRQGALKAVMVLN